LHQSGYSQIHLYLLSDKKTLLKAILESYVYYKIVDKIKLINDCFNNYKFILNQVYNSIDPAEIKIVPSVLVAQNYIACDELEEMESGQLPKLKALSLALGISFFSIDFDLYKHEL